MTVTKEVNAYNFEFWSGGKDTAEELTLSEIETVFDYLENLYWEDDIPTETDVNDFFWFERDEIAQVLGYNDFDEIMERNEK